MRTNNCPPFLCCLFFAIFQFGQNQADELDYLPSPLLLSLCTTFVPPSTSSSASSSTEQFPPLPPHSTHHRPPPTSSHIGQSNFSRSLALLSRPGQLAQLSLFAGANANGTSEEEWSKWMEPINGQLRCSLRLEACSECLIELEWTTPRTQFTDFQIQSLANCETQGIGGDEDLDLLLARSSDHRPCFGLNLVEERADRPLPPNAESTSTSAIFEPAYVFRRGSIWDVPGEGEENAMGRFKSSGNNLLLVATFRHISLDAQLGRWLRRLFPLRIRVLDNKVTILANKLPLATMNAAIPSNNNSSGTVNEGFIQSARFPAAYPRGIRQNLTIIGDSDSALRLQFDDFHLHYISELKIHDSDGRELFNSRREHRRPPPIETRSPSLSILFSAREFTEPIGFRARFQLVNNATDEWVDRPSPKNCDDLLDGFGGRIALEGQRHLLGEWVDCIWLVGRLTTGTPPAQQFDHLYLRVDQFHPRGEDLRLEVREGGNSQGRLLLQLDGGQSPKQLVQKQPEEGFTLAQAPDATSPAAFYIRLQGRLEGLSGLAILYAHFYQWPTALCPGGPDEFHCDNGKCIRASLRCDGYDHCGDSSDELCHFPAGGGRLEDGDDMTQWPSSVLTIAFGVLTMFLLVLLLVLFASRTARRHLVPSPLGNLYSLQSVRRRLRQQPQRRQQCCGGPQQNGRREHREERAPSGAEGSQRHQRGERGIGGGHQQHHSQQQNGNGRRNSSSMATQLDFAVLNNLLGSAAANMGPTIQTLGERRFFVLPADQAQISVIEAPPTYQDALKHPKVTPRGSRRLVHPSDGPIPSRRSDSQGNVAASAAYRNPAFRLSPTELLRMEMGRSESEGRDQREEELEATRDEEEDDEEEEFEVPQSPPTFRSESTLARSPREARQSPETEEQIHSQSPSQGIGRFETIDLEVNDGREEENNNDLDEATEHGDDGPSTSNNGPSSRQTICQMNLDMEDIEMIDEGLETPISSHFPPKMGRENRKIPEEEESQNAAEFGPKSARENAKDGPGTGKCESARLADRNPDRLRIRRPASSRRSTVPGE